MEKLKALFNKGFMKLTKGHRLMWVAQDEMVVSKSELKEFVTGFANKFATKRVAPLQERIEKLEEMSQRSYSSGYRKGLENSSKYTLILPTAIREENEHLVEIVGLIAGELLDQGDTTSCKRLLEEIYQRESL